MGWRPSWVRQETVGDFLAAVDGYMEFHGAAPKEETKSMTRARMNELMAEYPDRK